MNKPELMIGAAHDVFDANGDVADDAMRERIGAVVEALVTWTHKLEA